MANYFEQFHTETPPTTAPPANYFAQFHTEAQPAPAAPEVNIPLDVAKSYGVGLGKSAIAGAGAVGDIRSALSSGVDWLGGKLGISPETIQAGKQAFAVHAPLGNIISSAPTSEQIKSGVESVTGPFYKSQSIPGEFGGTFGEFTAAAAGGPAGIGRRIAQVAVPALASETLGQVYKGTEAEPYARAIGAVGGGLAVPGVAAAGRRAVTPFPISQERQAALQTLRAEGVDVPAGMATGSRQLNAAQSQLGGVQYQANLERMREQYTGATLRRAGINEPRATPDVLNAADDRIGAVFDAVAARNPVIPLGSFRPQAEMIARDFEKSGGAGVPLLRDFIERVAGSVTAPKLNIGASMGTGGRVTTAGSTGRQAIAGDVYQAIQSDIQRQARGTSNPDLRHALYDLKSVLDGAVQTGLRNPADAQAWQQARRQWANLITVQKAVTGTAEAAAEGLITPAKLTQAIESMKRGNYARGRGDFAELARAGNQVMKEFPDSGTASRLAAMAKPAALGALFGAGALTGGAGLVPTVAALAGPWAVGRGLTSRLGQQYLTNQRLGPGLGLTPGGVLPPVVFAPSQLRRQEEQ